MNIRQALLCASFFVGGIASMALAQSSYPPLQVLVSSSKSVLGQDLAYPPGKATITAAIVTMQPGEKTGWHRHEAPLFAMILDGEITLDDGTGVTRHYVKDDTFLEAFQTRHNGMNTGNKPVRILAVFAGADGVKNTLMEE